MIDDERWEAAVSARYGSFPSVSLSNSYDGTVYYTAYCIDIGFKRDGYGDVNYECESTRTAL